MTTAKKKRTAPQAWKSSLLSYHTLKLINFTSEMQLNLYFIVWYDNTVFPDVLGLKHLPPPSSSPAQVLDGVTRVHGGQPSDWTGAVQWPNTGHMLQTVDIYSCSPAC